MTVPYPVSAELATLIAQRLRVIGDPLRIRALDLLRDGDLSVGELTERLGTSQQNVSKHLGVLLQAGIVSRRKDGTTSRYAIADRAVYDLCEQVCGALQQQLSERSALFAGARADVVAAARVPGRSPSARTAADPRRPVRS